MALIGPYLSEYFLCSYCNGKPNNHNLVLKIYVFVLFLVMVCVDALLSVWFLPKNQGGPGLEMGLSGFLFGLAPVM